MHKTRIIARLDIKNDYVIKGIHLEGLRKVGNPNEMALRYYEEGVDELILMDAVASLYGRNNLFHIIERACTEVFVPITIGGGLRSIDDIEKALKSGADKVALNTQAVKDPSIVSRASRIYGSQCIIGSIEAKKKGNSWEVYVNNGREETGIDVIEWSKKLEDLGCGEVFVTSIDKEGTKKGFDVDLIKTVSEVVTIPVIASGGCGSENHIKILADQVDPSGVALASILHYNLSDIKSIKNSLTLNGIKVRNGQ